MVGIDEILRRQSGPYLQFVLPSCFHPLIFKELHNNMGHLGVDRVLALIRERFLWPGMQADVKHYITQVCTCLRQKKKKLLKTRAPVHPLS